MVRTVTVGGQNVFQGIESGYPITTEYQVGANTSYNDVLRTLPQLGIMMTWSEVESIKAELALKGFNTGKSPKQHYDSAITASMLQWGATMPSNYLAQAGVIYDNNASIEAQLENHYSEVLRFLLLTISLGLKKKNGISDFAKRLWYNS